MVNAATVRESGFAEGYLTGSNGFFQEMHPEDLPKLLQALQQAIETGEGFVEGMRMKALREQNVGKQKHMVNIWLSGDIKIFMPKDLMGGKRIGYFRIIDVRDTGEVVKEI